MPLGRCFRFLPVVLVLWSCGPRRTASPPPPPPPGPRLAEEVRVLVGPDALVGKFTALRGDTVAFRAKPYWRSEPRAIRLGDITRVDVIRPGNATQGFVLGFAVGFTTIGLLAGSAAEYDKDYSAALIGATVVGAVTGLIGAFATGGSSRTFYEAEQMEAGTRAELVRRLMSDDGKARAEEGTWVPERRQP